MKVIKRQRTKETKEAVIKFQAKTGYKVLEATKLNGKWKNCVRFLIELENRIIVNLRHTIAGLPIEFSKANPENLTQSYVDVKWSDLGIEI